MPRRLRYVPSGSLVEVTTRTIHERFLLRPSPEVNDLILGVIGKAQASTNVHIHALVFLSNHWHALLSVDDAAQLAAFMGFVNGNIARELARLHGWRDRLWSRRYQAIVVADDDAAVARLRYILLNGCKEGLVDKPADWPGVSCVGALTRGETLKGTWYDRTAESRARRRGSKSPPASFATKYEVKLSPLPLWRGWPTERLRSACKNLIAGIEAETRTQRASSGQAALGRERIMAQHPYDRPEHPEASPAPLVHASTRNIRKAFRHQYATFVDAFSAAASALRSGEKADFPPGAFPPAGPFARAAPAPS